MPTTHDLRDCYWGHSIEFLWRDQQTGDWRVMIFLSARIAEGDLVLARSTQPGRTLCYKIIGDVRRAMDPGDQHFATLHYVGDE